jgi:hypothetical protein
VETRSPAPKTDQHTRMLEVGRDGSPREFEGRPAGKAPQASLEGLRVERERERVRRFFVLLAQRLSPPCQEDVSRIAEGRPEWSPLI